MPPYNETLYSILILRKYEIELSTLMLLRNLLLMLNVKFIYIYRSDETTVYIQRFTYESNKCFFFLFITSVCPGINVIIMYFQFGQHTNKQTNRQKKWFINHPTDFIINLQTNKPEKVNSILFLLMLTK